MDGLTEVLIPKAFSDLELLFKEKIPTILSEVYFFCTKRYSAKPIKSHMTLPLIWPYLIRL